MEIDRNWTWLTQLCQKMTTLEEANYRLLQYNKPQVLGLKKKKITKTLQIFAAYLVAAWTFLQFIDWILDRYNISPYWVDMLLWIFVGIIPSLLIYLYHQERINQRILKLREKIIFPVNLILIMVVTYLGFGNSDLGATTKTIEYTTEAGEERTAMITKEEFREVIPIFSFKHIDSDSTNLWMETGIPALIHEDLLQNKNISPIDYYWGVVSTMDKISEASIFSDYYVDGSYDFDGTIYSITTSIREAKTGNLIEDETLEGNNLFELIDDMSIFIAEGLDVLKDYKLSYIDLPVEEITSSSLEAFKYYIKGDYTNAIRRDSTFALAYSEKTFELLTFGRSKLEAQALIEKGYNFSNRLPIQRQLEMLIHRNLAHENHDDAERLVKLQLSVDPSNKRYNRALYNLYGRTRNTEAFYQSAKKLYRMVSDPTNALEYTRAAETSGHYDEILAEMNKLALLNSAVKTFKFSPLFYKGDLSAAEAILEETKLLFPDEIKNTLPAFEEALAFQKSNSINIQDYERFMGTYRFVAYEQTIDFWIEKNRIIFHYNNQTMNAATPHGPNSVATGMLLRRTNRFDFLLDEKNAVYGMQTNQFDFNSTTSHKLLKIDNDIKKAENALIESRYEEAEEYYRKAIINNPRHYFLNDALSHIEYVKTKDSMAIQDQFRSIEGTYGPRKFSLENGRLYYKREDQLRREFLPISENRYMTLAKYDLQMAFENSKNGKLASFAYDHDFENDKWVRSDNDNNYFFKDD